MKRLIIAIDGPSGAREGHDRQDACAGVEVSHIDTGAMYRAVGWKAQHDGSSR
jgi:cytidylate kinase